MLIHDGMPIMPAGLPALAAWLGDNGQPACVWNLHAERRAGIVRRLERDLEGVRLVGISAHWFYQIPSALAMAKAGREAGCRGFVVLGGFTASLFGRDLLLRHPEVDGVIRGDGERPLLELARRLEKRSPSLEGVPNLVWRRRGAVRSNRFAYTAGAEDLDGLDFGRLDTIRNLAAHFEASSWREITDGSPSVGADLSATFYLCGGRGCSVACASCGGGRLAHRAHSRRTRVAFRAPERLADDVAEAMALGATSIHACFDPVPNGPHWHAFMDAMSRRNLRLPMIFESFGLPDARFLEHFAATFPGGIVVITAESADESIRRRVRGFPFTNADLEGSLGLAGRLGTRVQLFLGYFSPFEGLEGLHASRRWARDIARRHAGSVEVLHYPFSTDPGSPVATDPGAWSMSCAVRTLADYEREMGRQEPWLGNLLRHGPSGWSTLDLRAASLGVEIEQSLARSAPDEHARLERRLGARFDPFFTTLARKVLDSGRTEGLDRGSLHRIVLDHEGGEG